MVKTIIFDKKNMYWSPYGLSNNRFVSNQIDYMYERIRLRGYMYLNEVYDLFGAEWDIHDSNDCLRYDENGYSFTCTVQQVDGIDYKINIFY